MSTVQRGTGFPVLALVLGLVGTVLAALGLLGLLTPESAQVLPVLGEPLVAEALLATGGLLLAVETVLLVAWMRRRQRAAARDGGGRG